jgi:prephenate dehydrogenase
MVVDTLAVVGVGLIGGSVGLAARRYSAARAIIGCGPDADELIRAQAAGAIDRSATSAECATADLVIVCTPVSAIAGVVRSLAKAAVVTDVGSAKARVVDEVGPQANFVPGHPIAGSEKHGPDWALASLFDRRRVILTPTAVTDPAAVERVTRFWTAIGARVSVLDAATHDRLLASSSHLPHAVAVALAASLPAEARPWTAGGFRDTTRIAAGGPGLWADVFMHNRDAVLTALDTFDARLKELRTAVAVGDRAELVRILEHAKQVRDALGS